jgi:hypothetical protein
MYSHSFYRAVFLYLDLEIPLSRVEASVHGSSSLALFGYCVGMVRAVISLVLELNTSCWADSYLIYESTDATKWSAHVHVPLPFRVIGAVRETMARVKDLIAKLFDAHVPAMRPMFYLDQNKTGAFEWKCVVDMKVFTKKRNFRLPLNTKVEKNAHLKCANDKLPGWNRHPSAPCSVDASNFEDMVSAGMILARNSRAFWNPVTVKYAPLLKNRATMEPKPSDFRCLPPTGYVSSVAAELRKLYASGDGWPDQDACSAEQRVVGALHSFVSHMFEDDWESMTRPVLSSTDPATEVQRSLVKTLYASMQKSPRVAAITLMLLLQVYRPGGGLDQKIADSSYTLAVVRGMAEMIHAEIFQKNSPIQAFSLLFSFHSRVDSAFSRTCSPDQAKLRQEFFKELRDDFIERFLRGQVMKNAYNRTHLTDVFVLNNVCRYLLICSGFYVHCMSVPASCTSPSLDVLPHRPLSYKRGQLDLVYEFVFKTSFQLEGKQDAPSVSRMTARVCGQAQFVVHRLHYSEDLVDTIARIRATQIASAEEASAERGPNAMFKIVRVNGNNAVGALPNEEK